MMIKINDLFELSEKTGNGILESVIELKIVSLGEKEKLEEMLLDSKVIDVKFSYHKQLNGLYDENLFNDCMLLLKLESDQYMLVDIESSYWFEPDFSPNWHNGLMVLRSAIIPDDIVRNIEVTI